MIKRLFNIFILLFFITAVQAQELTCRVVIDYSQVQTVNQRVFQEMERAFTEFMNQTIWTKDDFEPEERINCNVSIKISEQTSLTSYNATVQIQSLRPIYGTDYESTVLNFIDQNFEFVYTEGVDIVYNETGFNTNLVSILAFYANIIIGMDYDTFSELGGSPYYEKARQISNTAQNSSAAGWKQQDGTNTRYWLIDNLLNNQFEPFRKGLYIYHYKAFDQFNKDLEAAQKLMIEVLEAIKEIRRLNPSSVLIKSYMLGKSDELVNIFKGAQDRQLKTKAMNLLIEIDPTRQEKYRTILN